MRISLENDPAEFVKQVADLRRFLNAAERRGGQEAVTSRLMTASFVPLLAALRTELRDEPSMPELMTAVSELMGNMAMTLIQSMFDAPPEAQIEALDRLLGGADATASRMIQNDALLARDAAEKAKPKLAIINGGRPAAKQEGN